MIPRHRPPFGPTGVIKSALLSVFRKESVEHLERQYACSLGVRHAIWIPSARYGITRSIQQVLPEQGQVVCPIFNCGAVFHAVQECGRSVQFADCAPNSFLMDCSGKYQRHQAVVLSEMFGHRFSADRLRQPLIRDAQLRVFDMAMAIPRAADMQRMRESDVTVLSFGLGKSLYAGWGGLLLTQCQGLADSIRRQRNLDLEHPALLTRCKWHFSVMARTLAHESLPYKLIRSRQQNQGNHTTPSDLFSLQSHEWHRPPTDWHVSRCLNNLAAAETFTQQRTQNCETNIHELNSLQPLLRLPTTSATALSHFSVRVPAVIRDTIREQLWANNIDSGTLFPFPTHLASPADFPNASAASMEVINLPLSNQLKTADIRKICNKLQHAIEQQSDLAAASLQQQNAA